MLMVPLKNGIKMIYGMEGMLVDDGVPIAYKPTDEILKKQLMLYLTLKQLDFQTNTIKL